MKYCDSCHSTYPTEFTVCPKDKTPLRETSELPDGSILRGKYQILGKIGAGGMATVYQAKHLTFNEVRALKVVSSKLLDDKDFIARFKNEAVITRKLEHPNAVRVDDFDVTDDGRPFIVMEYVAGKCLRDVLHETGPLPPQRAISIAKQVAMALSAANKLGIIHRDIKPENIQVIAKPDGSETVKVLDFGIAKLREVAGTHGPGYTPTQTGMVMGTPQYISPEQAMGQSGDQIDGRADVYSLGIVLYEMLTGDIPFKADTPMGLLIHHIHTAPTPPHALRPELNIPAGLSGLLMKALEKDREKRFQSADEMLAALGKPQAVAAAAPVATAMMGSASMTKSTPKPMKSSEIPTGPHEHQDEYADPESSQALRAFREAQDDAPAEEKGGLFDEDRARKSSYYDDWMKETEEETKVEPKRVEPVPVPSGPPKPVTPPPTAVATAGKAAAAAPAPAPQPAKAPQVFGKVQPTIIKTPPPTQSIPVAGSPTQRRMPAPPPKPDYRNYIIAGAAGVIITLLGVGYFVLRPKPVQPAPLAVTTPSTPAGTPAAPAPGTEDARIYDDVKKMLASATSDTLRAYPPLVAVDNGVVTLSGRVTSREDSMLADQLAGTVDGVSQVVNQMKIGGVGGSRATNTETGMTQSTLTPRNNNNPPPANPNVIVPPEEANSVSLGDAARQRTKQQNPGDNTQQQIDQQLRQGHSAMQSRDYDAAIQHFETVLQLDPQNPAALMGLRRARRLKNGR